MINLDELKKKLILEGLHEDEAEAKVCQDIILFLLSQSRFINLIVQSMLQKLSILFQKN